VRIHPVCEWFDHSFVPGPCCGLVCSGLSTEPAPVVGTAKYPEALCLMLALPPSGRRVPPPPRTLLPVPRSYGLMRQSRVALPSFGLYPRSRSLDRLLPGPAATGIFPTLSLRVFPVMPGPLPRRFADCFYLLLHLHHRPSPTMNGSACRFYPLKRLLSGRLFAGCSHFLMFKPHSLLATLVAPTTAVSCRAVSDVYIRAKRASLPPHAPDMLAV
jgi:hypothetical protein